LVPQREAVWFRGMQGAYSRHMNTTSLTLAHHFLPPSSGAVRHSKLETVLPPLVFENPLPFLAFSDWGIVPPLPPHRLPSSSTAVTLHSRPETESLRLGFGFWSATPLRLAFLNEPSHRHHHHLVYTTLPSPTSIAIQHGRPKTESTAEVWVFWPAAPPLSCASEQVQGRNVPKPIIAFD